LGGGLGRVSVGEVPLRVNINETNSGSSEGRLAFSLNRAGIFLVLDVSRTELFALKGVAEILATSTEPKGRSPH